MAAYYENLIMKKSTDLLWIGSSDSLKDLKKTIYKFSRVDFPVLIFGEKGTGKILTASDIHNLSYRKEYDFIESCCLQWDGYNSFEKIKKLSLEANGGTIFLRNINALPDKDIEKIKHYWEQEYIDKVVPVRIIASISDSYKYDTIMQSTAPWLTIHLPSLIERKNDIENILKKLLKKYSPINHLCLTNSSIKLIENHKWENNFKGIERAIALLSATSDEKEITENKLIKLLPEINIENCIKAKNTVIDDITPKNPISIRNNGFLKKLIENDLSFLQYTHSALSRSIMYVLTNFDKKITLAIAAKKSHISPSHLSYLYKKYLNISFKQFVLQIRVEKSKIMLTEEKEIKITEISNKTGFHDLSHFEKTFKKFVGINPMQYKNTHSHI